ncbi:hypothetical protein PSPO01_01243 [Paraphaeosphaeria sporulosa]
MQCNPLIYRAILTTLGFCPYCLGNESLGPEMRMR